MSRLVRAGDPLPALRRRGARFSSVFDTQARQYNNLRAKYNNDHGRTHPYSDDDAG